MSARMIIQSPKGPYTILFDEQGVDRLNAEVPPRAHFLIDARVADLYRDRMGNILAHGSVLRIEATEPNKSLDRFPEYVAHLVSKGLRRDHLLAATMLRGVKWRFYPTTLLDTLNPREFRCGIGEMLKVHATAEPGDFMRLADQYDRLFSDRQVMIDTIHRALEIKQGYIEQDEFDIGPRLVFNLGHSFGHAIEAATDFAIPHGIAVSMDMANWTSWRHRHVQFHLGPHFAGRTGQLFRQQVRGGRPDRRLGRRSGAIRYLGQLRRAGLHRY